MCLYVEFSFSSFLFVWYLCVYNIPEESSALDFPSWVSAFSQLVGLRVLCSAQSLGAPPHSFSSCPRGEGSPSLLLLSSGPRLVSLSAWPWSAPSVSSDTEAIVGGACGSCTLEMLGTLVTTPELGVLWVGVCPLWNHGMRQD